MSYPMVLVVADKITQAKEIVKVMDLVKSTNRPLLLFSEDLQQGPQGNMIYNQ